MSDGAMIPQGDGALVPSEKKELSVTQETNGLDVDGLLNQLFQYVNIGDILSHVEQRVEYVVQIPLKYEKEFNAKEFFMNENTKTGVMWPTLYKKLDNGKRQFVGNLPIKKEKFTYGNPFQGIAQSYHNIYLQQQMNDLANIMSETYRKVELIEQGQKGDRIGLLRAGQKEIMLSLNLETEERNASIRSGRSKIITAQEQIFEALRDRVNAFQPIPKNKLKIFYMEFKHSRTLRQRDKEFDEIQEYYALYLQATQMLAASFAICGQIEQAEQVYQMAEKQMSEISFEAVKTLQYIHEKNEKMLYYHAVEYVTADKQKCLEDAKEYDCITLQVSGEKLQEVLENGGTEEVSGSESE